MFYMTCEYCGAHLDPGEPCECRKHTDSPREYGKTGDLRQNEMPKMQKQKKYVPIIGQG